MPAQTTKSNLAASLGSSLAAAHKAVKDKPVQVSAGDCPAGVNGGVARLAEIKVMQVQKDGDFKGKWMFYLSGTVVLPAEHAGTRININEMLCATPGRQRESVEDHIAEMYNEIKKWGKEYEEAVAGINPANYDADLQAIFDNLKRERPFCKFSSVLGKKSTNPKYKDSPPPVYYNFHGVCDPVEGMDPASSDAVEDGTALDPSAEPTPIEPDPNDAAPADAQAEGADVVDLDDLAARADNSELEAQQSLLELADGLGIKDDVDNSATWTEGAALIRAAQEAQGDGGPAEAAADPEPEPYTPKVKDVVGFVPPKTKKTIKCQVTAVFPKNKTVTLLNLIDKKTKYEKVAWDALQA